MKSNYFTVIDFRKFHVFENFRTDYWQSTHRPALIEDGAVICTGAKVYPGAVIRKDSLATAQSRVKGEIPAGAVVDGESKIRGHVADMRDLVTGIRHPWMRHAADLYPPDARDRIAQLLEEILATR